MHRGLELEAREERRIHVGEPQSGMLAEDVPAAGLAPLARTLRTLVIRADGFRAAGDAQCVGLPQGKGIHGPGRPMSTPLAMAIAHGVRRAGNDELDCSAKT